MKDTSSHIFIIEDSQTQAQMMSLLLEENGYRVSIAGTGTDGLKRISEDLTIDLILLDVNLPDKTGFEVCSQVRQLIYTYIPILMLTYERTTIEDKAEGLSLGADEYLSKPFDPRDFLARITALLRVKQMVEMLLQRLTNEHQSYLTLRRIALTDHLTGLYNRHYFAEVLEREFSLSQRHNVPLACIMADIDNFRDFNNQYGHAIGDWVLQAVTNMMKEYVRQGDILARYGGEEFVILLPMTALDSAVELADRIRTLIDERIWKSPAGDLHLTLSFGVAAMPLEGVKQSMQLVNYADRALYIAKNRGRNRIEFYDTE